MSPDGYHIPLRDYEYLDKTRLIDYLTTLDVDQVKEIKRTIREVSDKPEGLGAEYLIRAVGLAPKAEVRKADDEVEKIIAKQSFTQLYQKLDQKGQIDIFSEVISAEHLNRLSVGKIVEITGDFEPLPRSVTDHIVMILELYDEIHDDKEARRKADLLRSDMSKKILMVFKCSNPPGLFPAPGLFPESCSVVFFAEREFLMREPDAFKGGLTVCGKVKEVLSNKRSTLEQLLGIPSEEVLRYHGSLRSVYDGPETPNAKEPEDKQYTSPWSRFRDTLSGQAQKERHDRGVREKQERKWMKIKEGRQQVDLGGLGIILEGPGMPRPAPRPAVVITPLAVYR